MITEEIHQHLDKALELMAKLPYDQQIPAYSQLSGLHIQKAAVMVAREVQKHFLPEE